MGSALCLIVEIAYSDQTLEHISHSYSDQTLAGLVRLLMMAYAGSVQ